MHDLPAIPESPSHYDALVAPRANPKRFSSICALPELLPAACEELVALVDPQYRTAWSEVNSF
jgi:hypothetical protein